MNSYGEVARSTVRLQWDPDHDPLGAKVERRAIQLGLRGEPLARYGREWLLKIEDISEFVKEQRPQNDARDNGYDYLITPREAVYPVMNGALATRLGISTESE